MKIAYWCDTCLTRADVFVAGETQQEMSCPVCVAHGRIGTWFRLIDLIGEEVSSTDDRDDESRHRDWHARVRPVEDATGKKCQCEACSCHDGKKRAGRCERKARVLVQTAAKRRYYCRHCYGERVPTLTGLEWYKVEFVQ